MSLLDKKPLTDELIDRVHYWVPPVPGFKPRKKNPNSSLRIAVIVGDRLYQGLRYEGKLLVLTPYNWEQVLNHVEIDFLLVESCTQTITGHWFHGQSVHKANNESLLDIIKLARDKSIPTVFWNTKSHLYHSHYAKFSNNFDYVFCADIRECLLLEKEGIKAEALLPAVQPAIHNGFREYNPEYSEFSIDVLYDGFTDLYRLEERLHILQDLMSYGLKIIDSQAEIFSTKIYDLPLFTDSFLGTVNQSARITALKYTNAAITFDETLRTETLQQWLTLEAVACRVPIIHRGKIDPEDIRYKLISCCDNDEELLVTLEAFHQDDLYRKRLEHLAWRDVYQNHTYAHRLSKICSSIGITHDYEEHPLASVIAPTFREKYYSRLLESFNNQSYPNKELILVVNNNDTDIAKVPELNNTSPNVHVYSIPQDKFAGGAMNVGNCSANGEYCFRLDDDDDYGKNYLLDVMLHLKAIDADIFGSPPKYYLFENEKKMFIANKDRPFLAIVQPKYLGNGICSISGNTLGGKCDFLVKEPYHDYIFGAADAAFTHGNKGSVDYFLLLDEFNMVIKRSHDVTEHTWRATEEMIKKTHSPSDGIGFNDVML